MKVRFSLILLIICCLHLQIYAWNFCGKDAKDQLFIGPRFSHLKRTREGGTCQDGYLYGLRGIYDHLGSYCLYWGAEAAWSQGTIKGRSGTGAKLKSDFTEGYLELRLGYTFQHTEGCCLSFTPFLGGGYYVELNNYKSPSPMKVHFRNQFGYAALGAIFRAPLTSSLSIALKGTALFSLNDEIKVSHDPEVGAAKLKYENKILCRFDMPVDYRFCIQNLAYEVALIPFFEFRRYGHHSGFPFDFLDTSLRIWGIDATYVIRF